MVESTVDFPLSAGDWVSGSGTLSGYQDNFAIRFYGRVYAPRAGQYTFGLRSKDGSKLLVDNVEIVDHGGEHEFTEATGTVTLTAGHHDIEVHYFCASSESGLILKWALPGESTLVVIPASNLFHAVDNEYCQDVYAPRIYNVAIEFETEDGSTHKLNLT